MTAFPKEPVPPVMRSVLFLNMIDAFTFTPVPENY
jgi:hypothetical protein